MPDESTEVIEVVEQATDAVVQQQEPTQDKEPVQVVVVDGIEDALSDDLQGVSSDVQRKIDETITAQMQHSDEQHTELLTLMRGLYDAPDSGQDGTTETFALSDGQFSQIAQELAVIRNGSSASLFVSFLTMLLVCIVIGTRLWSVMSRGWKQ